MTFLVPSLGALTDANSTKESCFPEAFGDMIHISFLRKSGCLNLYFCLFVGGRGGLSLFLAVLFHNVFECFGMHKFQRAPRHLTAPSFFGFVGFCLGSLRSQPHLTLTFFCRIPLGFCFRRLRWRCHLTLHSIGIFERSFGWRRLR